MGVQLFYFLFSHIYRENKAEVSSCFITEHLQQVYFLWHWHKTDTQINLGIKNERQTSSEISSGPYVRFNKPCVQSIDKPCWQQVHFYVLEMWFLVVSQWAYKLFPTGHCVQCIEVILANCVFHWCLIWIPKPWYFQILTLESNSVLTSKCYDRDRTLRGLLLNP